MVWPILISVSVTPGAFSARAGHPLAANAAAVIALEVRNVRRVVMKTSLFPFAVSAVSSTLKYASRAFSRTQRAVENAHCSPNRPGDARRRDRHQQYQQQPVDGARQSLRALAKINRELVGVIGHEFDEQRSEYDAADRSEAAHDDPDQERERERESETVGRDESDRDRAKAS